MPDYIYLLKNRLSLHQRNALEHIREAAREAGMTVFLVGGAVRDLTSGSPVADLDVTVQGDALKLKTPLEQAGGTVWGEHVPSRTLFFRFPVGVSVEISSARREEFPKPGQPVYHWDTVLEDLRRRDFTANAMALSLNEHSYGLLMDPLNGVADIEARQLRLVSNYGFIEDPSRLLRATRLLSRLGWQLDERTQVRYQNAKEENNLEALSPYLRGYELEEIGHEEDGLRVLTAMEAEGWMQHLFPAWTAAAADTAALTELRQTVTQLQMQGVTPDVSAASMRYLTAKLSPKDLASLQESFVRPGFVKEWNNLDQAAREFGKQLTGKDAGTASATWKLMTSADPQAVLWLAVTSKSPAIQQKYKNFLTVWPEARQKVPYALFQELRITPEIPGYEEMLTELFFGTIDGVLETEEQLREFLAPYSPPAPPPPVTVRRSRGSRKGDAKPRAAAEPDLDEEPREADDDSDEAEDPLDLVEDDEDEEEDEEGDVDLPPAPKKAQAAKSAPPVRVVTPPPTVEPVRAPASPTPVVEKDEAAPAETETIVPIPRPARTAPVATPEPAEEAPAQAAKKASAPAKETAAKPVPAKSPLSKTAAVKAVPAKTAAVKAAPTKMASVKAGKPVAARPVPEKAKATAAVKKPAAAKAVPRTAPKKAGPVKKAAVKKAVPPRKHR